MVRGQVTITDVAREAGVSIATVSRVMGDRASVSDELAQRVRAAAERLNYLPSPLARGLATGETGMVGVLVPQLRSLYFHELIKSIGVGAAQERYRMLVLESDDHPEAEVDLAASLYAHVDGLILCSPRMPEADLQRLAENRPRMLVVNRLPSDGGPPAIAHDVRQSMLALCGVLRRLGHCRVAFLAGSPGSWATDQRWLAVQEAAGIGLDPVAVPAGPQLEDGYAAAERALAGGVTALLGTSDPTALGAMARLRELGIAIPADVSVTGFGDITFSRYFDPPLTTVRIARYELGACAWDMMSRLLDGEAVAGRPSLLPGEVIERGSTGRAREPAAPTTLVAP